MEGKENTSANPMPLIGKKGVRVKGGRKDYHKDFRQDSVHCKRRDRLAIALKTKRSHSKKTARHSNDSTEKKKEKKTKQD